MPPEKPTSPTPLSERLTSLGKTGPELADIAGVDESTGYRWLAGGSAPYRKYLRLISDETGVQFDWLADGKGEREGGPASVMLGTPSRNTMPPITGNVKPDLEGGDGPATPSAHALPHGAVVAWVYTYEGRDVYGYVVQPLLPVQLGEYPRIEMHVPPAPFPQEAPSSGAAGSKPRATRKRARAGA
jgi:hypothetical protein